ncbi:imidazolonepropionase-like amidohydrolase [Sphingomonas jejuensis]|uniref:Imidazolonepropionase-like amidohydrolase n=2 Tax=Sphingomonas jejuensis TaxID=904715 RepID=A0ABX0XL48_9SPHN|nr:imidazolonepropionase-like amidohydrolase [Sphingomonas jejuensis]
MIRRADRRRSPLFAMLGIGCAFVGAFTGYAANAQTVAITGGTVALGDGSAPIPNGTVVIQNGRVRAAGAGVAVPAGAERIDATGKWVSPGIVAGFSRLGLVEVDAVDETNDVAARTSPFSAALDVVPALNPRVSAIAISRNRGVTRAVVSPGIGAAIFAGQGAVIDMGDDMNAVTRPRAFQFVELGEAGARRAGGSRAASHLYIRTALKAAQSFQRDPGGYDADSRDAVLPRTDAEALVPVVTGRQPLVIHAERGADILQALALKTEFPQLKLVLVGATEGWTVARQIAAAGVPVIASALVDLPAAFETLSATQSNIGRMKAAGVQVSIGMINDNDTRQARQSAQYAGNLVALTKVPGATGLQWGEALAAITSGPAEAMGLGDEIGSLRPGRRGDVVIWSGDPLELSSAPERVWIDGVAQPLETRQTRLRDRYATPTETALPKAYDRSPSTTR